MLRLACIFAVEAGVSILAPVHDAVLIEADEQEIDHAVSLTQAAMQRASKWSLPGSHCVLRNELFDTRKGSRRKLGGTMWRWITESIEP